MTMTHQGKKRPTVRHAMPRFVVGIGFIIWLTLPSRLVLSKWSEALARRLHLRCLRAIGSEVSGVKVQTVKVSRIAVVFRLAGKPNGDLDAASPVSNVIRMEPEATSEHFEGRRQVLPAAGTRPGSRRLREQAPERSEGVAIGQDAR